MTRRELMASLIAAPVAAASKPAEAYLTIEPGYKATTIRLHVGSGATWVMILYEEKCMQFVGKQIGMHARRNVTPLVYLDPSAYCRHSNAPTMAEQICLAAKQSNPAVKILRGPARWSAFHAGDRTLTVEEQASQLEKYIHERWSC